MKKVVISLNTSWNIYNFRLNLARAIKKSGYEVILVAPRDKYSESLKKEFCYHDIYMNNKGTNPKEDIKTIFYYYDLYKKIKPDVVLNFTIKPNIYGNIACKFLGIKTINNISGLGTVFIKESIITKIVKYLYKFSLKDSSRVFFQNEDDLRLFVENKLIKRNKCDLLPGSGVDTKRFVPLEFKKRNCFTFLLIARMLYDKGIQEYVDAARIIKKNYKNVVFQLLGSIDSINSTAITKEQMNIWTEEGIVNYLGETDNVPQYISKANCVVLPSYREGTPRTLLESASMGKPIITTNVPGCKNVIDDNVTGYLCKVKDTKDLSLKMIQMIQLSFKEQTAMGDLGRKKVLNEFDENIVIDKYIYSINKV